MPPSPILHCGSNMDISPRENRQVLHSKCPTVRLTSQPRRMQPAIPCRGSSVPAPGSLLPTADCPLPTASVHFSIPILPHCGQVTTSGRWALNTGMAALHPAHRTRVTGLGACWSSAGGWAPSASPCPGGGAPAAASWASMPAVRAAVARNGRSGSCPDDSCAAQRFTQYSTRS
jgi:hypothetical protein